MHCSALKFESKCFLSLLPPPSSRSSAHTKIKRKYSNSAAIVKSTQTHSNLDKNLRRDRERERKNGRKFKCFPLRFVAGMSSEEQFCDIWQTIARRSGKTAEGS